MKKFETPVIEIDKFTVTDVITTSGECGMDDYDDTGCSVGETELN